MIIHFPDNFSKEINKMSTLDDIDVTVKGANQEIRQAVATGIQMFLENAGFNNVVNQDLDDSVTEEESLDLLTKIESRYPDMFSIPVSISTIADPSEFIAAAEQEADQEDDYPPTDDE